MTRETAFCHAIRPGKRPKASRVPNRRMPSKAYNAITGLTALIIIGAPFAFVLDRVLPH